MPDHQRLFNAIEAGELDDALFELGDALKRRKNVLMSTKVGFPVVPGDKVTFKQDISPKMIAGKTATVVHTNGRGRTPIVVDLDQPVGRWHKDIRCSLDHLDLAAA